MRRQLLAGAFIYIMSSGMVVALADPQGAGQTPGQTQPTAAPPSQPQAGGDALPLMPLPVSIGALAPAKTPLPDVPAISPDVAAPPAAVPAGIATPPVVLPRVEPSPVLPTRVVPPPAVLPPTPPAPQPPVAPPVPTTAALHQPIAPARPVIQVVRARDDVPQAEHMATPTSVSAPGVVYATPRAAASTFQGKVMGLFAVPGVQVGIVSMKGRPWTNPANFQWGAVQSDGAFEIHADKDPDAPKALVVAAPGHPWTYAHWEFGSHDSAKDITMDVAPAKHVTVAASGPGLLPAKTLTVEVFDAHDYRMPGNKALQRQRLAVFTGPASGVAVDLASEPVGLYVSAPGMAAYYQIIDPGKADRFEFQLMREGAVDITVERAGTPAAGIVVMTTCPDAPFSSRQRTSDASGHIQIGGLPPGEYRITTDGGEVSAKITSGQTAQSVLEIEP